MTLRRKLINFDKKFEELRLTLDSIFCFSTVDAHRISGMNMYQLVYDMCNAIPRPFTDRLFAGIAEYIDKHTTAVCERILIHDDIVTAYAHEFERFELAAGEVSRGCDYLNRLISQASMGSGIDRRPTVVDGKYRKQDVQALALSLWKSNILFTIRDRYQNRLFYQVFEMIRRDRDGNEASYSTIKTVVTSLVQANAFTDQPLQLYIEEFERPYLVHTKRYFEAEAAREMASGNIGIFMTRAMDRLQQEILRNNRYCHSTSHRRVVKEFEAQYITAYQERIVEQFRNMLLEERFKDCTLAYNLLSRIPDGLKYILSIYEEYVARLGKDILAKLGHSVPKIPKAYVDQLLNLHIKYYSVNSQVFSSDPLFTAAVDKAFRTIVNDTQTNPSANGPETLARYCDMMMRKNAGKKDISTVPSALDNTTSTTTSTSGSSNSKKKVNLRRPDTEDFMDPEEKLLKMITLFKYVEDKDVFQKFYSRMLAKRLIYSTSSSEELEMNMINRLKEICGVEYTSKLNKMFTDMSLSNDLNNSFRDYLRQNSSKLNVGFDIQVLTAGAWPLNQKDDGKATEANKIHIPAELEKSVSHFESFYGEHHSGRKLLWQWNLARGELRLTYLDRPYEIQMGLFQMVLLLLFNTQTTLSVSEMSQQSGLAELDTLRSIKPLVDLKLLEASDRNYNSNTHLSLNMAFSSKRTKIKVAAAAQTEQQESQTARKAVDEDRRMYLQAAIVRIMKSRKALTHVQLVQEIIDQTRSRFSPSVILIKKCIEQLIEKQFIAREERDTYTYVA
ncbi:Cullin [Phascolomyces articulosus]|uniref:Cullin-5 n=1 Tax=Phascolomyces articulosus TaxID=60185 RepID=A0AAD5K8N0_9FUNG|nr:Cullin [Phascolomyces articulosus]